MIKVVLSILIFEKVLQTSGNLQCTFHLLCHAMQNSIPKSYNSVLGLLHVEYQHLHLKQEYLKGLEANFYFKYVQIKYEFVVKSMKSLFKMQMHIHIDLTYVFRASKFSVLKLIEIIILWVYCTIPFRFSLFRHFMIITLQFFKQLRFAKDY